jgi:hypothetical protein
VGLPVVLLGKKGKEVEGVKDPYTKWSKSSSTSLFVQKESTFGRWDKTEDKEEERKYSSRVEVLLGLMLWQDWEKSIERLFKLVSFDRELSGKLNNI